MFYLIILVLCGHACLIQTVLSQSCGRTQYSYASAPNCGYGGTGTGEVGVSGDIGASGTTCLVGSVPVLGSVEFSGCSPSCGSVCISGQCCDSEPEETCLASAASTNLFDGGNTVTTALRVRDQSPVQQPLVQRTQTALSGQCNYKQISSPGISGRSSAPGVRTSFPSLTITPSISQSSPCVQNPPRCLSLSAPSVTQNSPRRLSLSIPGICQSLSAPSRSTLSAPCNSCVSSPYSRESSPRVNQISPSSISGPCACQSSPCLGQSSSRITMPRVSPSASKSFSLNTPSVNLRAPSCNPSFPRISKPSSLNLSVPTSASTSSCAYGGSGTGEVGVSGNIGASGTTCLVGAVPVRGSVEFSGCSPTCGTVNISGQCECDG